VIQIYDRAEVKKSTDKLLTALRIAIAGNVIDFGVNRDFNIEDEIDNVLRKDFAIFDRILIEELKKPVSYAVREIAVINDVTYEDAIQAGIDGVATILSSGTSAPGTVLETCNAEFGILNLSS